jgi:serine/threonine-protein kinase RsbW
VNEKELELELPSRIESVETAATRAEEFARESGFDEEALGAIDMAVRESVANAIKHGNLLDETKQVELTFSIQTDGLQIVVRDFGRGFAVEDVPDPTNPENLLKENGRGILFMRAFMDKVEWSNHAEGGMVVTMLKMR